jgi:MoxR-like ATPase
VSIYNQEEKAFSFVPGPLFTNILLVDEVNRAAPRTQSCLLEAMEEAQITIEGDAHKLNSPFFVIATQNPIEYHGTFNLPEAQLDRFMVVLSLGYPSSEEESNIWDFYLSKESEEVPPVITTEDYKKLHTFLKEIRVSDEIKRFVLEIITATRSNSQVKLGASPRASLALLKMAQASAMVNGRAYTIPDDVKNVAVDVLSHRVLTVNKRIKMAENAVVKEIVDNLVVPS